MDLGSTSKTVSRNMTIGAMLPRPTETDPATRFGEPEQIGNARAFPSGGHAGFITGQNLLMHGEAYPGTA